MGVTIARQSLLGQKNSQPQTQARPGFLCYVQQKNLPLFLQAAMEFLETLDDRGLLQRGIRPFAQDEADFGHGWGLSS